MLTTCALALAALCLAMSRRRGLGLVRTSRILEPLPQIAGFAVVKAEAAIALRDAGIEKPVLLMGMCSAEDGHELVARGVQISLYTEGAEERLAVLAGRSGKPIQPARRRPRTLLFRRDPDARSHGGIGRVQL